MPNPQHKTQRQFRTSSPKGSIRKACPAQDIFKFHQKPGKRSLDLRDTCLQMSPVSETQLDACWRGNLKQGLTWAAVLKQYNTESQRFSVPPAADKFPERVHYQSCCGVFCRNMAGAADLLLFQRLLRNFEQVVSRSGGGSVAAACKTDILLRVRLGPREEDFSQEIFAWMTAMSARSGVHAPSQVFVLLEVVDSAGADGVCRLRLRSRQELRSSLSWCSQLLAEGPLLHYTEQEFADHLLDCVHVTQASWLCITRLAFKDVNLSTVDVIGPWPEWEDLMVAAGADCQDAVPAGPQEAAPVAASGARQAAPLTEAFDLLAEIGGGPPKGRGRGKGKRTNAELRKSVVAALPFDPAAHEALQAHVQDLLAEEHVLEPESDLLVSAASRQGTSDVVDAAAVVREIQDPVVSASVDATFTESLAEAVACCREASLSAEAAFEESGDEDIVDESVRDDMEMDASAEAEADPDAAPRGSSDAASCTESGQVADRLTSRLWRVPDSHLFASYIWGFPCFEKYMLLLGYDSAAWLPSFAVAVRRQHHQAPQQPVPSS